MSSPFNDTATKTGIIQRIERKLGYSYGTITDDTDLFYDITSRVNESTVTAYMKAMAVSGRWQVDDTKHTNYSIIKTNLVANQRDYPFVQDGTGNIILSISKVLVSDSLGNFTEIFPVDIRTNNLRSYWDGQDVTGIPNTYDKIGNSLFLDPIPNYNYTEGLKMYIDREAKVFTVSNTVETTGLPSIFDKYIISDVCANYGIDNTFSQSFINSTLAERERIINTIEEYVDKREKDVDNRFVPLINRNK